MRIEINLAQNKYQKKSTLALFYILIILMILIPSWFNYRKAYSVNKELLQANMRNAKLREQLEKRKKTLIEKGVSDSDIEKLSKKVSYVNILIEKQSFSWTQFLYYLEGLVPDEISITEINPSFIEMNVEIVGLGKSVDDIVKFVNNINGSSHFQDVFLLEHTNVEIEKNKLVKFIITFKYLG